jgi:phage tail sheath protein FI
MPEYLAPGVYVEETSFRSKSIEGVSTTTTGFVGPARFGPTDLEPELLTSLLEFERTYGDRLPLFYGGGTAPTHNYLCHAVRSFFEEGGSRLYVSRVFEPNSGTDDGRAWAVLPQPAQTLSSLPAYPPDPGPADSIADSITVQARFPGAAGNFRVRFTLRLGQNIFGIRAGQAFVAGLGDRDVVLIADQAAPFLSPPLSDAEFGLSPPFSPPVSSFWSPQGSPPSSLLGFFAGRFDPGTQSWRFETGTAAGSDSIPLNGGGGSVGFENSLGLEIRIVTLAVTILRDDGETQVWEGLPLDPSHRRGQTPDSVFDKFSKTPTNIADARSLPIVIAKRDGVNDGLDVLRVFNNAGGGNNRLLAALVRDKSSEDERSVTARLDHGNDGALPGFDAYAGQQLDFGATGLVAFEGLEDISIVAAPGSTQGMEVDDAARKRAQAITLALISHVEIRRYCIAVVDCGDGQTLSQVRALRAKFDSMYAAFYFPWVKVLDPVTRTEIALPPSGFVAGIYARNDIERAVYKAPANEVVRGALSFERMLNKSQQEVLNPEGINCFRFFEGRGMRLWGARTMSSDPEWKYVNLRRYFAYLERSIDKGTQWAVFEPNGEALWANLRRTIEDFLFNEWNNGALLGDKPEKSYFVKCDRTTMSQNDLDNGRLVCLIGVAPLRPAEFVIFRIGQWTADRKV